MQLNVCLFIIESSFYSSLLLPVEVLTLKIICVRIILRRVPKQGALYHHAFIVLGGGSFLRPEILVSANQLKVNLCKQYYSPSVNFLTRACEFCGIIQLVVDVTVPRDVQQDEMKSRKLKWEWSRKVMRVATFFPLFSVILPDSPCLFSRPFGCFYHTCYTSFIL